jgi:aryl-alcohol dehydrogenase-like predicted oxidoreductase
MTKKPFGKTGFQVSSLGFGAAEIGFIKPQQEQAAKMLNFLLDQGVNVIDTAAGYETSELTIGEAISHRRSEFVLISKCGNKVKEIDAEPWSDSLITQTVDRSLKRLKTDVLDVMLLHTCDEATLRKGEALGALVKARKAGKIKFAGFSGDNEAAAYAASLPDVAVIETSINITDQVNIDHVLPLARKNQIGILAKRPIANACWKDINSHPGFYKDYAKNYTDRLAKMKISPADLGIAGPLPAAWVELALRFTLSQDGVHSAIIGTANPENARQNVAAADKGPLPDPVVKKIRDAFAVGQGSEKWVGLT